jgi:hypothetical protein
MVVGYITTYVIAVIGCFALNQACLIPWEAIYYIKHTRGNELHD